MRDLSALVPAPRGVLSDLAAELRRRRESEAHRPISIPLSKETLLALGESVEGYDEEARLGWLLGGLGAPRDQLERDEWGRQTSQVALALSALAYHGLEAQVAISWSRHKLWQLIGHVALTSTSCVPCNEGECRPNALYKGLKKASYQALERLDFTIVPNCDCGKLTTTSASVSIRHLTETVEELANTLGVKNQALTFFLNRNSTQLYVGSQTNDDGIKGSTVDALASSAGALTIPKKPKPKKPKPKKPAPKKPTPKRSGSR